MEEIFYNHINEILSNGPELDYEWQNNNSEITLKKISPNGFDIILSFDKNFIYLNTNTGFHYYPNVVVDFTQTLIEVMGLVRDLLSKNMGIKEYCSNGKPYKWELESLGNNIWMNEGTTRLLFWNYFGKKSQKIYFNETLPIRDLSYNNV